MRKSIKKVIYTTITGDYDKLPQPIIIANDFDYILFTNDMPEQQFGVWQVRHIPYQNSNNVKLSRWVKTHPHILLKEYDVSLYHDGNVIIDNNAFYNRINQLIDENTLAAFMCHLYRHCIYEEGFEVISLDLDKIGKVLREIAHIKHDGYPPDNGLVEANCILRRHHDASVIKFCEEWWYMINHYAQRDQLSCNYVAWKCGIDIEYILPSGFNTRNHPYLHCNKRKNIQNIRKIIWWSLKDQFCSHARKYYDRFVSSQSRSFQEYYSFLMVILIRKYYGIVSIKYRVSTWMRSNIKIHNIEKL